MVIAYSPISRAWAYGGNKVREAGRFPETNRGRIGGGSLTTAKERALAQANSVRPRYTIDNPLIHEFMSSGQIARELSRIVE